MKNAALSPEAREWLDGQLKCIERKIIAHGVLRAVQSGDEIVRRSDLDSVLNEVLGKPSRKKQFGIAVGRGALIGGAVLALFSGLGTALGEYILKSFR